MIIPNDPKWFRRCHETISSARKALSRSRSCRSCADSMATTGQRRCPPRGATGCRGKDNNSWQLGGFSGENDGNGRNLWKIWRWLEMMDDDGMIFVDVWWICVLAVPCANEMARVWDSVCFGMMLNVLETTTGAKQNWQPFPCGGVPKLEDLKILKWSDPSKVESQSPHLNQNLKWEGISLGSLRSRELKNIKRHGTIVGNDFLVPKQVVEDICDFNIQLVDCWSKKIGCPGPYPTDSYAWSSFSPKKTSFWVRQVETKPQNWAPGRFLSQLQVEDGR
jgi:hypothetical protein